jgi:hypothetical protein
MKQLLNIIILSHIGVIYKTGFGLDDWVYCTLYTHNSGLQVQRYRRFTHITIFKSIPTLHGKLLKTGPVRNTQQTKQCVYNLPCDCGRCYIGETSRPLQVCIKEHKYNLTQDLIEKSKLAQHACEKSHKICGNEAKVLKIEPNTTYRKYKESAHMSLVDHPIR